MKALFGLLVVLAIVGLVVKQQLHATTSATASAPPGTASMPGAMSAATGDPAGNATTVRDQARQTQQQVRDDVARALEQGTRRNEADQ
jgi:hypothetical protein